MQKITTHLWFDDQAEEAVRHYTSVFPDSRVLDVQRYGEAGPGEPGTVMTISFELAGQRYIALNGGPEFHFTEAVSLYVDCADQDEVDRYWAKLGEGGSEGPCGWLKDKFGLSWQVVPRALPDLLRDPDPARSARVMKAMLGMGKIDVKGLEDAYNGETAPVS
ncbi:Glyoxalase superfamily enzyme, possibly 3-demethylubiquinone-9 3-methyltransferase [Streptomyces sp. WMMB 714]|uniref:VOC family protein n=1 Tax=Streptomyces sp. WMMB 714 TaxID=1286822 RepID=UPI0005F773C9|nr:VOC family protein [Streptomyces sp. WMMB 714]SCK53010.1 Glyoxalase superfamily enzyme, possibly 3-demethylubiquinone-9 3-methyltransferase [Streptomyces sp. WMMB 714]